MATQSEHSITIPLVGVESEHCAMIVRNGLGQIKNIEAFTVETNNRRAVVETTQAYRVIPEAVHLIRSLGYGVTTVKDRFPVLHMTCASCAVSVESMIKAQPGVIDAQVNFASASVQVEYIPGTITRAEMRKAVQAVGYDLLIDNTEVTEADLEVLQLKNYQLLQKRTLGAVILTIPLVVIGMFFMGMPFANLIMWVLATPVLLIFGKEFYKNAWKQARHRSANMDTLVALSTSVAYIFSVFNTLFPGFWLSRGLHPHVYFEAAAVIVAFILLGKLLEEKAKGNTSSAIKKLMGLQPKSVTVHRDGTGELEIPIGEVVSGDIIVVKPGDKIAVDGTLTKGSSYVDESMISGEPISVLKRQDDPVYAGTINQKGIFYFKAEKVGSDTILAQIIRTVQEAQGSKAPVQKLVDKVAGVFVPIVILIALCAMVSWIIFGGVHGITQGILALVTVLVIACPCALGLATPTAIMVGVGKAAGLGILIKDAESLERIRQVDTVVFDKTGTITEGKPRVTDIVWLRGDSSKKHVLFAMEKLSEHPLAEAVVGYFKEIAADINIEGFESITGKGLSAKVESRNYWAGNQNLLDTKQIRIDPELKEKASAWAEEAKTVIWFADDEQALAVLSISDNIKASSVGSINTLKNMGLEVYMLTGDNLNTAQAIALKSGIEKYQAEMLPEQKTTFIKELQQLGKTVAMVGDGINDSSALAQADVSIAMGRGSDIAMDVAQMTIISSDLGKIVPAIRLSKQTVRTIRQNLFWAFIYNLLGIPIAAGLLYPFTGFLLNPMIAGAAMALSSVSVVGNSLRLHWRKM